MCLFASNIHKQIIISKKVKFENKLFYCAMKVIIERSNNVMGTLLETFIEITCKWPECFCMGLRQPSGWIRLNKNEN